MFSLNITSGMRDLAKTLAVAGFFLSGLTVSNAQAAIIDVFVDDLPGWQAAAGGPVVIEDFGDLVLVPELTIQFGSSRPGSISGGEYHDRASDTQGTKPIFTFTGLGATAFGANFDLGPNNPGTGIRFFVTFTDLTTQLVLTEIPELFADQFFGIVSDMAIRSIQFDEGTQGGNFETFDMTNARIVSAVPIPAALPLFLSAIVALGFLGRRRKQLAAA